MLIFYLFLGYAALYLVIWMHEVGHGFMYKYYGCKENAFKVSVVPYLFFSTPLPIDIEKAGKLKAKENFYVGMAGIAVNLIFGIPLFVVFMRIGFKSNIIFFFFYTFALLHLVEAASYLCVGSVLISSDMITLQDYKPWLRVPAFLLGILTSITIGIMIVRTPYNFKAGYTAAALLCIICMGIGRVIFSRIKS